MAEVACQTVGWRFATVEDREVITAMVADAAEQASLRLTPPELATSPAKFRRPDGTSVFRPKHSTVFSSDSLLAAEDHLLQRARTATGPTIDLTTVGTITSKADSEGRGSVPIRPQLWRRSRSRAGWWMCWWGRRGLGRLQR